MVTSMREIQAWIDESLIELLSGDFLSKALEGVAIKPGCQAITMHNPVVSTTTVNHRSAMTKGVKAPGSGWGWVQGVHVVMSHGADW